MRFGVRLAIVGFVAALSGCQRPMFPVQANQNPWGSGFAAGSSYGAGAQAEQLTQLSKQMAEMSQQLSRFDVDNQGLTGQVASLQQKLDAANNYNYQLKQQLRDSVAQLQHFQQTNGRLEQQLAASTQGSAANGSFQLAGNPTIRANNSLMSKLGQVQAAGVKATMDGDVIRVELSSDQVFAPGTYQIQTSQQNVLNQLAASIRQHFPQQCVGIEAHWDHSLVQGGAASVQQLTATQALAVFAQLSQSGLPAGQLFTVAMGSGRPRYPANAAQNRRIEVVIYPETFGTHPN